jgi:hypothetical protein
MLPMTRDSLLTSRAGRIRQLQDEILTRITLAAQYETLTAFRNHIIQTLSAQNYRWPRIQHVSAAKTKRILVFGLVKRLYNDGIGGPQLSQPPSWTSSSSSHSCRPSTTTSHAQHLPGPGSTSQPRTLPVGAAVESASPLPTTAPAALPHPAPLCQRRWRS